MKKLISITTGVMILGLFLIVNAQENPVTLSWSGYLQTDNRVHIEENNTNFTWQEYRLDLKGEVKAGEKTHFYTDVWLRSLGFDLPKSSNGLQDSRLVFPVDLALREAYVDIYGFLFSGLDLRLGRQRIAWGTADRINPTDNINPADLEDIWDFGRRLGSDGALATYYLGKLTVTGVYTPFFRPALLPRGDFKAALSPSIESTGIKVINQTDTLDLPGYSPAENSVGGARIKGKALDWDFSVSYLYGRDGMPVVDSVTVTSRSTTAAEIMTDLVTDNALDVDIKAELTFPRYHVAGLDVAGSIFDVGVWAEAALFMPTDKIYLNSSGLQGVSNSVWLSLPTSVLMALAGNVEPPQLQVDTKPYLKWVIGFDYTFPANIYVNLQYVHGFIHERGRAIEDYVMGNLDWRLFEDRLKITPIGVGLEVQDWDHPSLHYAFVAQPQLTYYPVDNAELTVGARIIQGKAGTYFGKVANNDEMFLKVKYSF